MSATTKRHYRPGATKTVTVKATPFQTISWSDAARRWGKGTPGAFLAWAGDMAVAALNAFDSVNEDMQREIDEGRPRGL
jgi:hypothetical protein